MPRGRPKQDSDMLTHALLGYEHKKAEIEEKIREIRSRLGKGRGSYSAAQAESEEQPEKETARRKRRPLSAEARKRIAAAQKKRWAEHRKTQTADQ